LRCLLFLLEQRWWWGGTMMMWGEGVGGSLSMKGLIVQQ
jgi:hypothetical protein